MRVPRASSSLPSASLRALLFTSFSLCLSGYFLGPRVFLEPAMLPKKLLQLSHLPVHFSLDGSARVWVCDAGKLGCFLLMPSRKPEGILYYCLAVSLLSFLPA